MQLPKSSEWLCTQTGLLRSQYAALAVDQLVSVVASVLLHHNCPGSRAVPAHILRDVSELCAPVAHCAKALPVVEALLLCKPEPSSLARAQLEGSPPSGLSLRFLEVVSSLQRGGESYTSQPKLKLGHEARVALWMKHLPSFEQELLDIGEAVHSLSSPSTDAIKQILFCREVPQACMDFPPLFNYCEEFFRVLVKYSGTAPVVLQLVESFNYCLAVAHSQLEEKDLVSVPQLLTKHS